MTSVIVIFTLISITSAYFIIQIPPKYLDYQLLLTYKKYIKVIDTSAPAPINTLADMLQTTNQFCMKKKLQIYDPCNTTDHEIDAKHFSLTHVINGKSRDMREAYAVMLAGPLCSSLIREYFKATFHELLNSLKDRKYEENLDCFKDTDTEKDCLFIVAEFTKSHVLNIVETANELVEVHGYPRCIQDVSMKLAIYNYRAVVYANSSPYEWNFYEVRKEFVDMMRECNEEALKCILDDLRIRRT